MIDRIPDYILDKYKLSNLEDYKREHGGGTEAENRFYRQFLNNTDYVIIKALEKGEIPDDSIKEYREFARLKVNETEVVNWI